VQADMSGDPPPQALSEADAIVSFGPMDGLAAWLALQERVVARGLVATSSMSAVSKRDSPVEADRALSARLRAGEAAVIAQCERLGIAWTILRPTMIYGAGLDRNLTPVARMARRTRVLPMPQASACASLSMRRTWPWRPSPPCDGGVRRAASSRSAVASACRTLRCSSVCAKAWAAGSCLVPVPGVALRSAAALLSPMRGPLGRLEMDLVADNCRVEFAARRGSAPVPPRCGYLAVADVAEAT
jgi:hypothetical protein